MKRTTEKNLMVFSGRAHPGLADEVVDLLETSLVPSSMYQFANSEIYVRYEESVRGCDAFVIQSHTAPINEWIMEHLMALPILTDYVREKYGHQPLAVVSPDAGRIKVAERWSARLGGAPLAFIHKTRNTDRPNETVANRVVGQVEGRICVLVDDMIDTGGTIVNAAEALMNDGAAGVVIAATHALLSDPAVDRLKNCPATEIVVTNTLPLDPEKEFDKLTCLSIAPLLARAIREVFEDGSVTSMFDGHA